MEILTDEDVEAVRYRVDETASPDVIRKLLVLEREGLSKAELRRAYADLEMDEQRRIAAKLTDAERTSLIELAERAEDSDGRLRYRQEYCKIRDDVVLREKLSSVDESLALAWREADRLERTGLTPQDVAKTLRERLDEETLDIAASGDVSRLQHHLRLTDVDLLRQESSKPKKPVTFRRGFLDAVSTKEKTELPSSDLTVAATAFGDDSAFEDAVRRGLEFVRPCSSEKDHRRQFLAFIQRAALGFRPGPPVERNVVEFMLEIHRRRTVDHEDDVSLKRRVLAHVQEFGPTFFKEMTSCAKLITALQDHLGGDIDLRFHCLAHYGHLD